MENEQKHMNTHSKWSSVVLTESITSDSLGDLNEDPIIRPF